jgi:hypothetical protein
MAIPIRIWDRTKLDINSMPWVKVEHLCRTRNLYNVHLITSIGTVEDHVFRFSTRYNRLYDPQKILNIWNTNILLHNVKRYQAAGPEMVLLLSWGSKLR